jgi:hypothetical protein
MSPGVTYFRRKGYSVVPATPGVDAPSVSASVVNRLIFLKMNLAVHANRDQANRYFSIHCNVPCSILKGMNVG